MEQTPIAIHFLSPEDFTHKSDSMRRATTFKLNGFKRGYDFEVKMDSEQTFTYNSSFAF